jgi:hypothetical protein
VVEISGYPQPENPKVHGRRAGRQVCEALGLDPEMVRDITISFPVDGLVRVDVVGYVRRDESAELMEALTQYALVEVADA